MNVYLNKFMVYFEIHRLYREGFSIRQIGEELVLNRRTVSKYLSMSELEFEQMMIDQSERNKVLSPYESFVKSRLEKFRDTPAAQMHDWLKEHFKDLRVHSTKDIEDIAHAAQALCKSIGKKIAVVVNYDNFQIDENVFDAYTAMVKQLSDTYYTEVSRYTTSAFMRLKLGKALEGKMLSAASAAVAELAGHLGDGRGGPLGDAVGRSATVLLESLVEHREERLLMGGTANLTRNTADFGVSLRPVLEAL